MLLSSAHRVDRTSEQIAKALRHACQSAPGVGALPAPTPVTHPHIQKSNEDVIATMCRHCLYAEHLTLGGKN